MRRLLALPSLALLLAAGGTPAAPSAPPAVPDLADVLAKADIHVVTTLIDAGAEPRALLRYAPRPGAVATTDRTITLAMTMGATGPDGRPLALPSLGAIPPMVSRDRNTVLPLAPNGFSTVRIEHLDSPTTSPTAAKVATALHGLSYDVLVDPNGVPTQVDVTGGDPAVAQAVQQLADQFTSAVPALPQTPVGVGAKWTLALDLAVSGMDILATETCTLAGASADGLDIDVELVMAPGPAGLVPPGLPPGAKVDFRRFDGTGKGRIDVDLATMSTTGKVDLDLAMDLAVSMPPANGISMSLGLKETMDTVRVD